MTIEWLFAAVLFCAFAFLTMAFRRPDRRPLRTRGPSRMIRWDAPPGH